MVKVTCGFTALVPPRFVIVTFCDCGVAPAPMVNVAVTWVALTTARLETVMPGPALMAEAPVRFVPVRGTLTEAPWVPAAGFMAVNVGGAAELMVNAAAGLAELLPPGVVIVTFWSPVGALAPIRKVAVTCVAPATVRFDTVMP